MNIVGNTIFGAVLFFAALAVCAVAVKCLTTSYTRVQGNMVRTWIWCGVILLTVIGVYEAVAWLEDAALKAPTILGAGRVVQLLYPTDRPDLVVVETDKPARIPVYGRVPFRIGQELLLLHHRKDNTWWLMRKGAEESYRVYIQPRGPTQ